MGSIMIIDDSEADQFLIKVIIERFNPDIRILQAYDGQEALEKMADLPEQPSVIFLDINMPRMNGHEFLEKYDAWEEQAAHVIILTSSGQEHDKENSMAYKCVKEYCVKPLDITTFEVVIQPLLQKI